MTPHIPLTIITDPGEPGAAEVYVEGMVNGQPRRFLLDTGAAQSSVQSDAQTGPLPIYGTNHSSGVFAPMQDDVVLLDAIELGPIRRHEFPVTRVQGDPAGRGDLIGMDLLREHCCHFRFDQHTLLIDGPLERGPSAWEPLRFDSRFHPYVEVTCGAETARAVWDSGASLTVADLTFIRQHPALFTESGASTGTDASGAQVETAMFAMAAVQLGGVQFPPHRVAAVDLSAVNATLEIPMDLIIGYNLYHQANWLFDFLNRRWAVTRIP